MSVFAAKAAQLMMPQLVTKKNADGARPAVIAILAVFSAVIILIAALMHILTAPFEFAGELGIFQQRYSYLVAPQGSGAMGQGGLSETEIETLAARVSEPKRQEVIRAALSLVGRVPYFWGGKSGPGWNEAWGTLTLVTSPGSSTSNTMLPYGMDCTGFVHWAYWTALGTDSLIPAASNSLWYGTREIAEAELLPGDIVYKDPPGGVNHAGIYYGENERGDPVYIHCSFSGGGVVMNTYDGFRYFRRAPIMEEDTA